MSDEKQPSVAEALTDLTVVPQQRLTLEENFEEKLLKEGLYSQREYAKLAGLRDHFQHKKYWSWFLMGLMLFMVVFQSVLIGMVGTKEWDFKGYDWLLPTLMIQYLVQIVGLAVFVVKSLFRSVD